VQLADLHPRRFFLDTWRALDRQALANREAGAGPDLATLGLFVCVVTAASLILQEYWGNGDTLIALATFVDHPRSAEEWPLLHGLVAGLLAPDHGTLLGLMARGGRYELWSLCYWAGWRVLGFLFIPLVAVALHPGLRLADLGLSLRGQGAHLWVYALLAVPVLGAVGVVSCTEEFTSYYPFYRRAHESLFDFAVWEVFYVAQFFALEVFFRGFMLQALGRVMGSGAIFVMVLPYVMIHFGKPMIECFAAIIAGVVLGTLALRTRSVWLGFLLHVTVALGMDLAALWQLHWR